VNYWDDVGFPYPQSDRWKTPYGVRGAKRFVAQEGQGLLRSPDRRGQQLAAEQARRTYQGLLARDMIGIEPYALWAGRATQDPDVGFQLAPMDVVPAGAIGKGLAGLIAAGTGGLLARQLMKQPVNRSSVSMMGYHGGRKWAPEKDAPLGRPRLENVGQGEGAQVYGHGFYVAENPEVGRGYFRALDQNKTVYHNELNVGGMDVVKGGVPVDYSPPRRPKGTSEFVHNADQARAVLTEDLLIHEWKIKEAFLQGGESGAKKAILDIVDERLGASADDWPEIIPHLQRVRSRIQKKGVNVDVDVSTAHLYKMDVPDDDVAKMLDWDKPLSEQQLRVDTDDLLEEVTEVLYEKSGYPRPSLENSWSRNGWDALESIANPNNPGIKGRTYTGEDLYADVQDVMTHLVPRNTSAKAASEYLASKGIPGLKYLDQGSRTAKEGTRNMVIWDEELLKRIKVLERQ